MQNFENPENGPRVKKLYQAYTKLVNTVLSKCLDPKIAQEIDHNFKQILEKHFIKEKNMIEKLNKLDNDIKQNRVNLRDIRCEKYIKEIFESYLYAVKHHQQKLISDALDSAAEEKSRIKREIEAKTADLDSLRIELLRKENEVSLFLQNLEDSLM
ncbi:hypothetical protein EDEG_00591 [Edhazardia aedis USNM 41457]|uniref:Uncharacterized protein n=1 Tax=Edhazardia aedis (strain USNM 41457) TaxID=1003232 RepID=J9DS11_EDHAE|nr:hypothetical protein EDEG_00591 [Edhazardia aedis USNM 41457]|eukprot:EJW05365.1 hypothetical protein EDEG_00591 [Edhazardia aedis USNM 41457]